MAEFNVNPQAVGELNPDGSIKRDVRVCALTGVDIEPGDGMYVIPGTNMFYRLKAGVTRISGAAEARQDLEAQAKKPASKNVTVTSVPPVAPIPSGLPPKGDNS